MALTRKFLSAMGIETDKIDEIINAHAETVDALKDERDKFKENAEKYQKAEEQIGTLKKELAKATDGEWQQKYNDLKTEFKQYKADVEAKETKTAKETAYRRLLAKAGISEKRIDAIMKVSDVDGIKIAEDGTVENEDEHIEDMKKEWSDFIVISNEQGASTATPPAHSGGATQTKADIMKIKDTTERQKAWAEYLTNKEE